MRLRRRQHVGSAAMLLQGAAMGTKLVAQSPLPAQQPPQPAAAVGTVALQEPPQQGQACRLPGSTCLCTKAVSSVAGPWYGTLVLMP